MQLIFSVYVLYIYGKIENNKIICQYFVKYFALRFNFSFAILYLDIGRLDGNRVFRIKRRINLLIKIMYI